MKWVSYCIPISIIDFPDSEREGAIEQLDLSLVNKQKRIAHQWIDRSLSSYQYKIFIPYLNSHLSADCVESTLLESEKINKKAFFIHILEMVSLLNDQPATQNMETQKLQVPLFDYSDWYNPNQMIVQRSDNKEKRSSRRWGK